MTQDMNTTYGFKKQISRLMAAPKLLHEYAYILLTGERSFCEAPSFSPSRRTASSLPTDCQSAPYGLFRTLLLLFVLLVTLGAWGQIERNYTGTYYIANCNDDGYDATNNASNFYLCPSTDCYDGNTGQKPFLTTHTPDTNKDTENISKWKIVFAGTDVDGIDYYYIKYVAPNGDEKYIVHNEQLVNNLAVQYNQVRVRYHLQADKDAEEDNNLFFFKAGVLTKNNTTIYKEFINICSKAEKERENGASLNPAKANMDYYEGKNQSSPGSFKRDNITIYCGGLIGHWNENDKTGLWFLEDIVERPVVSINSDGKAVITSSDTNATYKYSTDGNTPSMTYDSNNPIDITNVVTIKAIAVVDGEESNEVTYTVGNGSSYLIQNQECRAYYMVPEQKESGNISINTSSVAGPKMEWYIRNAGAVNGLQYYYIVNKSTSSSSLNNYLTKSGDNIYINSNSEKLPSDDTYKFYFRSNTDGSYSIYPKGVMEKSFHKDQGNGAYPNIVISTYITYDQAKWKFIPSSEYTFVAPTDDAGNALTLSSESSGVAYYNVASVGTAGSYIISNAASSTSGSAQDKSWMLMEAGTDSWQTYYYIVSAATGKYIHFLGESGSTSTLADAVEMTDLPESPSDNYKYVLARAKEDNTYYIIPKTHYDCFEGNKFYCLSNTGSQINAELTRASKNNTSEDNIAKWTFNNAPLFCLNSVFSEAGGNIKMSCLTLFSEIHYTTDGTTPTAATENIYTDQTEILASNQHLIKAISVLKNNTEITSEVVTLFNKPDVTLAGGPYTYKAAAWEPSVTLSVSTTQTTTGFLTTYGNHTDAGTANVTITDADDTDVLYIWNVPVTEFTIDKAPLTIKANDKTIGYGDDPDNDGVTYNGFVGNPAETESVLGGTLGYSYTTSGDDPQPYTPFDAQYGNQGSYVITPSGLTSTNYNITFMPGTMTVTAKSIGDGALAEGFTLEFDEDGNVILKYGSHTLTKDVDYAIGNEVIGTKYSTRTVSGEGNYGGSINVRNAIVNFTTDANQSEWSATFVAESSGGTDIGHALPEGVVAYIISGIEGAWAIPEPLEYIPADVPVLLVTHEAKNGFLVKDASNVTAITPEQIAYNKLKKVTTESAHFNTRQIYVLYKNEFVLNKGGDLGNGKVYMENPNYDAPSPSPAPANLRIAWGNSTGIETVRSEGLTVNDQSDRWYTLDGRCLIGKPTTKGLYIVNGKKIVIK